METGYIQGDCYNLPKVDYLMVASFFVTNKDFCSGFNNVKSLSPRKSYGDDSVAYVQLKRDSNMCTVKCRVCPEHKFPSKTYSVTIVVDEKDGIVISSQCHDCATLACGCPHALAFLMWLHRRSEEPSFPEVEYYWEKTLPSKDETISTLKYITVQELAGNTSTTIKSDSTVYDRFVEYAMATGLKNCALIEQIKSTTKESE